MAPEFGDTQVLAPQALSIPASAGTAPVVEDFSEEVIIADAHLPSMGDLDGLVAELDAIDATLAELR